MAKERTRDDLIDSIIHTRTKEHRVMPGFLTASRSLNIFNTSLNFLSHLSSDQMSFKLQLGGEEGDQHRLRQGLPGNLHRQRRDHPGTTSSSVETLSIKIDLSVLI